MKRLALLAAGLTGLLASCGQVIVEPPVYSPVNLKENTFTSSWYVERTENGQTVRDYIICSDRDTTLYMNAKWTGPLSEMFARFTYQPVSGMQRTKEVSTGRLTVPDTTGSDEFSYVIAKNTLSGLSALEITAAQGTLAAQNLKAQAIVVNPVNDGVVFVDLWATNPNGVKSNELKGVQGIPVRKCGA